MKKMVLRKWVVQLLVSIILIAVLFMASDCDNTKVFVISHLTALGIMLGCTLILKKYSNLFE